MTGWRLYSLSKHVVLIGVFLITTGCATTQTTDDNGVGDTDPIEPANRIFFDINETLDKHLLKPVAEVYVDYTPVPVRTSITNFFDNLTYLNVILNDLLQGKFEQGMTDMLRFTYNSTFGIAGLFDVSTPIGMPANDEDFGQTLATWGIDKGFYLYIPLLGPNTVRGATDMVPSTLLNPFFYVTSTVLFPVNALNAINKRGNLLEASNIRDEAAIDPYSFTREAHLQQREFLIYDGNPPASGYDDIFDDEEDDIFSDAGDDEDSGVLVIE